MCNLIMADLFFMCNALIIPYSIGRNFFVVLWGRITILLPLVLWHTDEQNCFIQRIYIKKEKDTDDRIATTL